MELFLIFLRILESSGKMKPTYKITEVRWYTNSLDPTLLEAWPGLDFSTPWINQWLLFKPVCWIWSQAKCCWLTYHFSQLSLSVTYSSKLSVIKTLPLSSAFSLTQSGFFVSWYSFFLSQWGILHSCLIGLAWVIGLIWVFPLIMMMMLMVIYILRSNHVPGIAVIVLNMPSLWSNSHIFFHPHEETL